MFHFYIVFLLNLLFTYSVSIETNKHYSNRSIVSSRSIYELVQIRRAAARLAAYHNRTRLHNNANKNELYQIDYNPLDTNNGNEQIFIRGKTISNNNPHQYLTDRFKLIIGISGAAVGVMILIVIVCVVQHYIQHQYPKSMVTSEQSKPLNTSRPISRTRYYESRCDRRNFSRKQRANPITV